MAIVSVMYNIDQTLHQRNAHVLGLLEFALVQQIFIADSSVGLAEPT